MDSMSARDDYPILAWLAGEHMTGINGNLMEIAITHALDEIDRLRAAVAAEREIADRLAARLAPPTI